MIPWLAFRLEAPMASFAEGPGNAVRATASWPTRSALLGLVGAALGVDRADREGQAALSAHYRFVIRVDRQGAILRDFHTYQSLPSSKGRVATRAEALRNPESVTSITRREYLCDALFFVAMRCVDETAHWTLGAIREALQKPSYALCLGRRCCPPGSPLAPRIVMSENGPAAIRECFGVAPTVGLHAAEVQEDLGSANLVKRVRRRADQPIDRTTWTFTTREEWLA
jgi:CRISPR system Cascade subunit CasD